MQNAASKLIRMQPDRDHLMVLAQRLRRWLVDDLNRHEEPVPDFSESRARALLRATDVLDEPTRHSFDRLVERADGVRLTLYELLDESGLAEEDEVAAMAAASVAAAIEEPPGDGRWLSLAVAAFAWRSGYPLYQLDPASPPDAYSPAGQVLKRAAYLVRQQVQRSATERDKMARALAYDASESQTPTLDEMGSQGQSAPLPPHYRPPIPVNYPEMSRETIQVEPGEDSQSQASRGQEITITSEDLNPAESPVVRQPPIEITADQLAERPPAPTNVVTPSATVSTSADFGRSVRRRFGRSQSDMKSTKLKVIVQEYPDGEGLYGLQVRVSCKGIKSHVAGTTTREGTFISELPVPLDGGLTYDVDVTWPRDMDGEVERKSITLNSDRTHFSLPFYRRLKK